MTIKIHSKRIAEGKAPFSTATDYTMRYHTDLKVGEVDMIWNPDDEKLPAVYLASTNKKLTFEGTTFLRIWSDKDLLEKAEPSIKVMVKAGRKPKVLTFAEGRIMDGETEVLRIVAQDKSPRLFIDVAEGVRIDGKINTKKAACRACGR